MTVLKVLTYPDPFLKTIAKPVTVFDHKLKKFTDDMSETMYSANGIGLAATQVGEDKRLFVIDVEYKVDEEGEGVRNPLVMINPIIMEKTDKLFSEEGCLSVPDYRAEVERFEQLKVKYNQLDGTEVTVEADGLFAICIQHELDHLDGILFIDKLPLLKRKMIQKKLKKQAAL
jgi:peptide deformylase